MLGASGPVYVRFPLPGGAGSVPDQFEREVYLPAGEWKNINTGEKLQGGKTVAVKAPIDEIPVFEKM